MNKWQIKVQFKAGFIKTVEDESLASAILTTARMAAQRAKATEVTGIEVTPPSWHTQDDGIEEISPGVFRVEDDGVETPPELYNEQSELDAVWCDVCGVHHGGDCPDEEEN